MTHHGIHYTRCAGNCGSKTCFDEFTWLNDKGEKAKTEDECYEAYCDKCLKKIKK